MTKSSIQLTERDQILIQHLYDYGILSSRQMANWFFKDVEKTTVLRRLRRLEKFHYIRRKSALPDGTLVFVIGENGIKHLGEVASNTHYPVHQLPHEILLADIRWQLEGLGVVKAWVTERTLRSEIVRQNPWKRGKKYLIPDALIHFEHFLNGDGKVHLELELSAKSNQRYRERFRALGYDSTGREPPIWYLVPKEAFGRRLFTLLKKYGGLHATNQVFFTVIQDFKEKNLEAMLYAYQGEAKIRAVFKIPDTPNPAHMDAQGLSRENREEILDVAS